MSPLLSLFTQQITTRAIRFSPLSAIRLCHQLRTPAFASPSFPIRFSPLSAIRLCHQIRTPAFALRSFPIRFSPLSAIRLGHQIRAPAFAIPSFQSQFFREHLRTDLLLSLPLCSTLESGTGFTRQSNATSFVQSVSLHWRFVEPHSLPWPPFT